jgi:ketosteroid isomerase-like protein
MLTVRPLLTAVLVASVGCRSGAPSLPAGPQTFDSLNVALDAAYRARDAAAVMALFAPDARLGLIDLPDITGRDALRELLTPFFAANVVREFRLRADDVETYDSVAYERGVFRWDATVGGQPVVQNGRYSLVRRRSPSGEWLIHRFLENLLPSTDSAGRTPASTRPPANR